MVYKFLIFLTLFCTNVIYSKAQTTHVVFETEYGNFKVMLYDFTPQHKALFLKEVQNGTYKNALFNRIVAGFVVQGGEHDDEILAREEKNKKHEGRLAPEFDERAFHKIGALGAGRDDNIDKASFYKQIYFVVGGTYTKEQLNNLLIKNNKSLSDNRQAYYLEHGGQPRLDNDYTVFGEVIEGLDVLMQISKLPVIDKNHSPHQSVYFSVKVLN